MTVATAFHAISYKFGFLRLAMTVWRQSVIKDRNRPKGEQYEKPGSKKACVFNYFYCLCRVQFFDD
ncbi:hypothetical protein GHO38_15905 [Pseudomonas helleri]|nr:hypothetical protein [Pseudomonas helleri]